MGSLEQRLIALERQAGALSQEIPVWQIDHWYLEALATGDDELAGRLAPFTTPIPADAADIDFAALPDDDPLLAFFDREGNPLPPEDQPLSDDELDFRPDNPAIDDNDGRPDPDDWIAVQ